MKSLIFTLLATGTLATLYLFASSRENHEHSPQPSSQLTAQIERIQTAIEKDFAQQGFPEVSVSPTKKPESYWEDHLPAEAKRILRDGGTEPPYKNAYWDNKAYGLYRGADDGQPLFHSEDKYKSGTGWPSFTRPVSPAVIKLIADTSHGWERVEVISASTGGHLGHVFEDGPPPTGLRFCLNSAALEFEAGVSRHGEATE